MEPELEGTESPYDRSGVDLTLIRWMLDMTPAQRLEALQAFVDSVWQVRGGDDEA